MALAFTVALCSGVLRPTRLRLARSDWARPLRCTECGALDADFVVSGGRQMKLFLEKSPDQQKSGPDSNDDNTDSSGPKP